MGVCVVSCLGGKNERGFMCRREGPADRSTTTHTHTHKHKPPTRPPTPQKKSQNTNTHTDTTTNPRSLPKPKNQKKSRACLRVPARALQGEARNVGPFPGGEVDLLLFCVLVRWCGEIAWVGEHTHLHAYTYIMYIYV